MRKSIKTLPGSDTAIPICGYCAEQLKAHRLTPEEKAEVQPGAFVKVNDNGEGFGVKVVEVNGEKVIGTVDNDLVKKHSFAYGDWLELEMDEIYQVIPREE